MYDRDAVLAATDLAGLADELLGPHAGSDQHPIWCCPSPNHAQTGRTPPVSIFTSRWDEQHWHCHGCGDGGTAIDLVMRARGVGVREAVEELAGRAHIAPEATPPADHPSSRLMRRITESRAGSSPTGRLDRDRQAAIENYVSACAQELWTPAGRPARRWLTEQRGLPEAVLRTNRVGADLGRPGLQRPDGVRVSSGAVVLPVHEHGRAVYFQARVLHPNPGRPRYLNPPAQLATNPKVSLIEAAVAEHPEIIVTEGAIDALSAASAGYRAAAVLSAGYPDRYVALRLSRLDGPLVLAMDPDPAGRNGSARLAQHLEALQRPATVLPVGPGDLNDTLRQAGDWPRDLGDRVRATRSPTPTNQRRGVER